MTASSPPGSLLLPPARRAPPGFGRIDPQREALDWTGLSVGPGGLCFAGRSLRDLARAHGTPAYVYDAARVRQALGELRAALAATGLPAQILFAMKANRHRPLLSLFLSEGDVGIDACSPGEVERALAVGFRPEQVSFTGGMLSERDLVRLVRSGVHLNLDSRSALRRLAAMVPGGHRIGLRIDPGVAVGYGDDPKLAYGNSKFGFLWEDLPEVFALCQSLGLVVDTLHTHLGWGLQRGALAAVEGVLERLAAVARAHPGVEQLNLGGGLGARRRRADQPLRPGDLVPAIQEHLGPLGRRVLVEPGTFLIDAAGLLLVEVNTVEPKGEITWAGVDAGHAVNLYAAHYGLPPAVFHVERPLAAPDHRYHLAGHINEAVDVFCRDVALPELEEGDHLVLYPGGAYGSSMASQHCLRGDFVELLIEEGELLD